MLAIIISSISRRTYNERTMSATEGPREAAATDAGERLKRSALIVCTAGAFLTPYMGSSLNVALPFIGRDLGAGAILLSWVTSSFMLAAAVFLLPAGRFADIHGRKRVFMYGIILYTFASFLASLAWSAPALIAIRVIQGSGGAMMFGANVAILTAVFPPGERGRVLGINVASVYLGNSVGPFVGGLLTQHAGWRSIFMVNVPIGLFLFWLLSKRLPGEWAGAKGERFDYAGSGVFGLSMIALMLGFTYLPAGRGAILSLAGVLGFSAFLALEWRTEHPVLNVRVLSVNRVFMFSSLAALANYCATAGTVFLLSLYLQYVKGLPPSRAGMVLLIQPLVQTGVAPFAGRLSDRIEPRVVSSIGMLSTAAGLLMLATLGETTPIPFIAASLVLLGVGFGTFSSPNTNAVMSSVDRSLYGVASATLGTMRLTGQILSMGIVTVLLAVHVGHAVITAALHPRFLACARSSFMAFALLCLLGVFASLARGRIRTRVV